METGVSAMARPRWRPGVKQVRVRDTAAETISFGVEVVSPILRGLDGLQQVVRVAELLKGLDARVNASCGFHVHVGVESVAGNDYARVADWIRRLVKLTAHHELALYAATGTHRRVDGRYCHSLHGRQSAWSAKKDKLKPRLKWQELHELVTGEHRYQVLNLQNVFHSKRTVEFRCFAGTVEPLKMRAYVQMCLALARRALSLSTDFDGYDDRGWYA